MGRAAGGRGGLGYGGKRGEGAEQGAGPVTVAVLAGVEAVGGELAWPGRLEMRGDFGDGQAADGRGLVDRPVDPGHVRHAGPAEDSPAACGQRQAALAAELGPDTSAAWVRVRYGPMVAMISTGERRGPPPRSAKPERASIQAGRETAGIRCTLAPHRAEVTRDKRS